MSERWEPGIPGVRSGPSSPRAQSGQDEQPRRRPATVVVNLPGDGAAGAGALGDGEVVVALDDERAGDAEILLVLCVGAARSSDRRCRASAGSMRSAPVSTAFRSTWWTIDCSPARVARTPSRSPSSCSRRCSRSPSGCRHVAHRSSGALGIRLARRARREDGRSRRRGRDRNRGGATRARIRHAGDRVPAPVGGARARPRSSCAERSRSCSHSLTMW